MCIEILNTFKTRFKAKPYLYCSPGRVNLIGEHTDYNDGYVLPAAIDKQIYFAIAPNSDQRFCFYAKDLREELTVGTDDLSASNLQWANYLIGVIAQFQKSGSKIPGFDCVFGGDVPLGAGMSSSAAIECGLAFAINDIFSLGYRAIELAKIGQAAEHEFAGVQCGIMDQFAILFGEKGKVIKLDCRSLEHELFPLNMDGYKLILVNTGVKHALAASEYNIRREECELGLEMIKRFLAAAKSLRDVTLESVVKHEGDFPPTIYKRITYVLEENKRVEMACDALNHGDIQRFGRYMYSSHEGLREKYEVSCKELDELVEIACNTEGVIGSRMMGGGFGGCTINLVEIENVPGFKHAIKSGYRTPDNYEPEMYEVSLEEGTRRKM